MGLVLETMQVQQRKHGDGPYRFQRVAKNPIDSLIGGVGSPAKPVGMIVSCFRPSDDACSLPFLVPSNLFAVTTLRQLAEMLHAVANDAAMANQAQALALEVEQAVRRYGVAKTPEGEIWAYEADGFGGQMLMDDANVPSLLGLPYLESSPDRELYARTRAFVWSARNPWFIAGKAGAGIGGPHIGKRNIWPMSLIVYALTSSSDQEIANAVRLLKASAAGTGFMHESFDKDDVARFTRSWFAWANTLFGELISKVAMSKPSLLEAR
jgi:meiotically up-regulated gene 157 (Mug157) protein